MVYTQFRRWQKKQYIEKLHHHIRKKLRQQVGRAGEPSAGIIDSQSIKTTEKVGSKVMTALKKLKLESGAYSGTIRTPNSA